MNTINYSTPEFSNAPKVIQPDSAAAQALANRSTFGSLFGSANIEPLGAYDADESGNPVPVVYNDLFAQDAANDPVAVRARKMAQVRP